MPENQFAPGEKIRQVLARTSQRHTRPRQLIAQRLSELALSGADFSIDDLWRDLRMVEPRLGRATLYRSIELLVASGVLDRIEFADGTHRYRVCGSYVSGGEEHHHLTCIRCHRVVEVKVSLPLDHFRAISEQTDFMFEGLSLTLFGLCAGCRSQQPALP